MNNPFMQYTSNTQPQLQQQPQFQWNVMNDLSSTPGTNQNHPQQQVGAQGSMNSFQNILDNQTMQQEPMNLDQLNSTDLEELIRGAQGSEGSPDISDSLKGLVLNHLTNATGNQ